VSTSYPSSTASKGKYSLWTRDPDHLSVHPESYPTQITVTKTAS